VSDHGGERAQIFRLDANTDFTLCARGYRFVVLGYVIQHIHFFAIAHRSFPPSVVTGCRAGRHRDAASACQHGVIVALCLTPRQNPRSSIEAAGGGDRGDILRELALIHETCA
jgi:hypothetical protein